MTLYLVAYKPNQVISTTSAVTELEMLYVEKWLETNSLKEINTFLMSEPGGRNIPLLSSNDKERLAEDGRTVLLFGHEYWVLFDMSHDNNKDIWREIAIDSILE